MRSVVLHPSRVLTDGGFQSDLCVVVNDGIILGVMGSEEAPANVSRAELEGDLVPGFVDLQVNGGGGVLFNDHPTVEGIAAIAQAHRRFGTTGLLPTLISDELAMVKRAIEAVDAAIDQDVPGVLGIHIEGPFLNPVKKGIHDASKFRMLDTEALDLLTSLRRGRTLVTLAPETAPAGAIRTLVERGVIVAAGHTAATFDQMQAAIAEGLSGVTHLFNAMTQLGGREPGVVGAALDNRSCWCGVIADGHHVHPATLRVALAAKGPEHFALVTDAMSVVGSDLKEFRLGGQRIIADGGRCVGENGTLAGSNLNMAEAVRRAERLLGVDRATAIRMASEVPAAILGLSGEFGTIRAGMRANLALVDDKMNVLETWIAGEPAG